MLLPLGLLFVVSGCTDTNPLNNGTAPPDTIPCHTCGDSAFCPWGDHELLRNDYGPAWSPDGNSIAFTRSMIGAPQIWLMRSNGSEQGYLTLGAYPDWSPNGAKIAFEHALDIYVITLSDSAVERLTEEGSSAFPRWSPEGTRIAYYCLSEGSRGMWVMKSDGTDKTLLFSGPVADWSPDGREMVFQRAAANDAGEAMWVRDLESGEETAVTEAFHSSTYGNPRWSPDGELIAWSVGRNWGEIWLAKVDGSDVCRLHAGGATEPAWSLDSRNIAFVRRLEGSIQGSCTKTIWTMRSDGEQCTQLTFEPE